MLETMNPSAWWWILVHLFFSLFISIVQLLPIGVFVQMYASMFLVTSLMQFQLFVQPSVYRNVNCVGILLSITTLVFLIFATAFYKENDLHNKDRVFHAYVMIGIIAIVLTYTIVKILSWVLGLLQTTPIGKAARIAFLTRDVMS